MMTSEVHAQFAELAVAEPVVSRVPSRQLIYARPRQQHLY